MSFNNNIIWGISSNSHDASLTVVREDTILFASHSERYSKIKNDPYLNSDIIKDALVYGYPSLVIFYENEVLKKIRQLISGQYNEVFSKRIKGYLREYGITCPIKFVSHHESHAAGGYYTSDLTDAAVVVIDSIGEFETFTIWEGKDQSLRKVFSQYYPDSIGLWYSAMTQRIGLKPLEHEYILMGMSAYGDSKKYYDIILNDFFEKLPTIDDPTVLFKHNLHRGCLSWRSYINEEEYCHIAAAVQKIYEEIFDRILLYTNTVIDSKNLVLSGGCALNCVANIKAYQYYDNVWIMPNPGDAGSSLGAICAHEKQRIKFNTAFLGHNIDREYPAKKIIEELLTNKVAAVACGKSEFGPRALGHRSILADPRDENIKDKVNSIKHREKFRPFAPMILEDDVVEYFDVPENFTSPYMQFTVKCKYPKLYPGIVHVDGSSRVQTINSKHHPDIYNLLVMWKKETGCPMLLNTSLNIKGQPLLNDEKDAEEWTKRYGVKVFTGE